MKTLQAVANRMILDYVCPETGLQSIHFTIEDIEIMTVDNGEFIEITKTVTQDQCKCGIIHEIKL